MKMTYNQEVMSGMSCVYASFFSKTTQLISTKYGIGFYTEMYRLNNILTRSGTI
jgi:hypothetical protein